MMFGGKPQKDFFLKADKGRGYVDVREPTLSLRSFTLALCPKGRVLKEILTRLSRQGVQAACESGSRRNRT